MKAVTAIVTMALLALAAPGRIAAQPMPCGIRPNDWCAPKAGDACGRHRNVEACRADSACYGVPYAGQSAVKCAYDRRGFGTNCPTVGCTSAPPAGSPR